MPAKGFRVIDLEAIEAGEALHFDELGFRNRLCPSSQTPEVESQ